MKNLAIIKTKNDEIIFSLVVDMSSEVIHDLNYVIADGYKLVVEDIGA